MVEGTGAVIDWGRTVRTEGSDARPIVVNTTSRRVFFDDLRNRLRRGEGFAVATMNLDHVVKLRRNPAFRRAYRAQTHVVADGNPIVWLSRLSGHEVELMPGSDLTLPLVRLAAEESVPIALVGSTERVLERARAVLTEKFPGLDIALTHSPPFDFNPEGPGGDAVIAALQGSGARFCLLALGAPKQEILSARALQALPGTGFASIGAGLDFITGRQTRAPEFVRRYALEWLWRLTLNPMRLGRRYFDCFAILPRLTVRAIRTRSAQSDRTGV